MYSTDYKRLRLKNLIQLSNNYIKTLIRNFIGKIRFNQGSVNAKEIMKMQSRLQNSLSSSVNP